MNSTSEFKHGMVTCRRTNSCKTSSRIRDRNRSLTPGTSTWLSQNSPFYRANAHLQNQTKVKQNGLPLRLRLTLTGIFYYYLMVTCIMEVIPIFSRLPSIQSCLNIFTTCSLCQGNKGILHFRVRSALP